jgi:mRNA interferase RelE/StbE
VVWTAEYAASVQRTIRKLDPQVRKRIRDFIEGRVAALDDPRTLGKPLRGQLATLWGYRVGDYRIIYEIQDERLVILVVNIGHRREVYR